MLDAIEIAISNYANKQLILDNELALRARLAKRAEEKMLKNG